MKSPQEPTQPVSSVSTDTKPSEEADFERELEAVEQTLHALKQRYTQVQQDQHAQTHLLERQNQIQQQLHSTSGADLKNELQQVRERLEELELNLESRLFSLSSLKEPFWQIVRFGGLGLVLGWALAFCTLQQPKPESAPNNTPSSQNFQR
jgi:predicted RNase H-like nuclease (RuvC/YqgF family)